jgi:chromosome segregation ATPase
MDIAQQEQGVQNRLDLLVEHLATIRRNHEKILAENKRLREVARLAEGELRKRREQIEKLQLERQNLENKRLEAKARIEHTIEKIGVLTAENTGQQS